VLIMLGHRQSYPQFSCSKKIALEDEKNEEDGVAMIVEVEDVDDAQLFKDLLDNDGAEDIEDEELEDEDGLDPAVEASNHTTVEQAIEGIDYTDCIPHLLPEDIRLGWFSVFKVLSHNI
jgi:hypothetical protein